MKVSAIAPGLKPLIDVPRTSAQPLSRARAKGERAGATDEAYDERTRRVIALRATRPFEARRVVDFGYGDLIAAARETAPRGPEAMEAPAPAGAKMEGALGADLSEVRGHPGWARAAPAPIQRKATVSTPGDPSEREADEVADRMMRAEDPAPTPWTSGAAQSKCAACEDVQLKCAACERDEATIQTSAAHAAHARSTPEVEAAVQATRLPGEPLPEATREYFERRFGHDFSGVRIHAGGEAQHAARAVGARAYTHGSHIVFGSGQYAPATGEGKRLLAHELTHVVQQGAGRAKAAAPHARGERDGGPTKQASHPPAVQRQSDETSPEPPSLGFDEWLRSVQGEVDPPGYPRAEIDSERAAVKAELQIYKDKYATFDAAFAGLVGAATPKDVVLAQKNAEAAAAALEGSANNYLRTADKFVLTLDDWILQTRDLGLYRILRNRLFVDRRSTTADRYRVNAASRTVGSLVKQQAQIRVSEIALSAEKDPNKRRQLSDQLGYQRDRLERASRIASGASVGRFPPGTWGKDSQKRCYVVYDNEVRVGGDLGWRLRNRGSKGRGPSERTAPGGALGHVPAGECGGRVGLYVYESEARSKDDVASAVRGHAGADLRGFLRAYLQGKLSDKQSEDMGNNPELYVSSIISQASACAQTPLQTIPSPVDPNSERIIRCIVDAIVGAESGSAKAGDIYTCDNARDEYFAMLGCDAMLAQYNPVLW